MVSASKHLPLPFRVPGNFALPPTTANSAGEPSVVDYIMPSKDETDLSPPIAKIDPKSARQISSGQVVVDLAGAVKELVENALDAHASSIDLRIAEDSGVVEIECVDNGHGIAPRDFALVAMPSATSKTGGRPALTLSCIRAMVARPDARNNRIPMAAVTKTPIIVNKTPIASPTRPKTMISSHITPINRANVIKPSTMLSFLMQPSQYKLF